MMIQLAVAFSYSQSVNPYQYIATLMFDGTDWFDKGEKAFPVPFDFNTLQDANADGIISPEDNLENYIVYVIDSAAHGTGKTGLTGRGPNKQHPAVYFHIVKSQSYDVYEYWLYYADNDWLNNHEHDWEKYFVYVDKNGVPFYIYISNHNSFNGYDWSSILTDNGHPLIGVDGGSHAMKTSMEDGVMIRYNGEVIKNNGTLIQYDTLLPWLVFSNDPGVLGAIPYVQWPDTFYYGDPFYGSSEFDDPRPAPWLRQEWDSPPPPPVVGVNNPYPAHSVYFHENRIDDNIKIRYNSPIFSIDGKYIPMKSSSTYLLPIRMIKNSQQRFPVIYIH